MTRSQPCERRQSPPLLCPGDTDRSPGRQRHKRSTAWFTLYRRGGRVILHRGHIRPVLIPDWSPPMDGISATIWASRTTLHHGQAAFRHETEELN